MILLFAVLVALLIGYQIAKWVYSPHPTVIVHQDHRGETRFNESGREPLGINFELLLNSNVAEGQYQFYTDEPNLITYLRREE